MLGSIPVLKARMNADLHMAEDVKNTGKGNLVVILGEPDIDLLRDAAGRVRMKVNRVAGDPYGALKTTLKTEIDADEVMKVFRVA